LESDLLASLEQDGLAAESMRELIVAGGKRFRPALVFLCAQLRTYRSGPVRPAAMAVELVHAATLVHDDVIDGSMTRRGRPSVLSSRGQSAAIVVADYYFARAYLEASRTGKTEAVAVLARAIMQVCDGELVQQANLYRYSLEVEEYLRVVDLKTAALTSAACEMGALLGGLGEREQRELAAFGRELGIAYQIADDVLDYVGTTDRLGKPVGHDLIEGNSTLPLIIALADEVVGAELRHLLTDGLPVTDQAAIEIVERVLACNAPADAMVIARQHVEVALGHLQGFASSQASSALHEVAEYVMGRQA
jgi:geranylgeranyl pyrophosphate synthase